MVTDMDLQKPILIFFHPSYLCNKITANLTSSKNDHPQGAVVLLLSSLVPTPAIVMEIWGGGGNLGRDGNFKPAFGHIKG